ncbi:MAG: calcium/sodium antiporter [Clostridia bacterium]|nr:calcium/sodium antiporter [Clostridia bacterium]
MFFNIFLIIIGFVCLLFGANILVKGSSNIAKKFYIPEIIIGLTIVCIGTSLPELMITITSSAKGYTDLIVGNAIGSNLCNLLLILGLISMIKPMIIDEEVKKIHIPVSIIVTILVLLLGNGIIGNASESISRVEGLVLLIVFIVYFSFPIYTTIKDILKTEGNKKKVNAHKDISIIKAVLYILIGIVGLKFGSDFVVDNAIVIANYFGISEKITGLTIIAVGTALPELITSIVATMKKEEGLAIGNLIGSCILNLCLILGVGAIIRPLNFSLDFNFSFILSTLSLLLLWLFCYVGKGKNRVSRIEGGILFSLYALYMASLFIT